jgi:adenosyl cobinamide kinase/adenosyl cobinamide phosphate guanylyltransferase
MPITFDSLDELKQFCTSFLPRDASAAAVFTPAVKEGKLSKKEAKLASAKVMTPAEAKLALVTDETQETVIPMRRVGRPKGTANALKLVPQKDKTSKKAAKAVAPKKDKSAPSLTDLIRTCIDNYLATGEDFAANDVYAKLCQERDNINKQSVITSVLKQMNTTYAHVTHGERAGAGPRAIKVYFASKAKK